MPDDRQLLTAPGKLFLAGEYAVLWGGVARVMAVAPRVHARVRRRLDREVHLHLEEGRLSGLATPQGITWSREVPASHRFAAQTLDLAMRLQQGDRLGLDLIISPSPAASNGRKLGMGGSGRAAVLTAAAVRFVSGDTGLDPLRLALFAHAHAQEGKGSGGDVAASYVGGVIRYRRFPVENLLAKASSPLLGAAWREAAAVEATPLPIPKLPLLYVFSGHSASTPKLISRAEERLSAEDKAHFVVQSDRQGAELERALIEGDLEAAATACAGLSALLTELGSLLTEPMAEILAVAQRLGATGKISGAGGGDGCICFCPDERTRSQVVAALSAKGFFAQAIEPEPGLRFEAGALPIDEAVGSA